MPIILGAALLLGATALARPVVVGGTAPAAPADPIPVLTIDLNHATAAELTVLPGVGPTLARAIVEDRRREGPFAAPEDLDRVPRVGPGLLARIRPHVTAAP